MIGRNSALVGLIAVVLALGARFALADTITVHDLSQNTSTGVFTYSIQLDSSANIHSNDGFVIYDFPGLTSWSITGAALSSPQFTLTSTLTSNTLTESSFVDLFGSTAAVSNGLAFDDPSVPNLSFGYVGPPVPFLGATTATLTLTSSLLGGIADSVYASVDHSGSSSLFPYSFAANAIVVPGSVIAVSGGTPLPKSLLGGAALFGLIGLGRMMKSRKGNYVSSAD